MKATFNIDNRLIHQLKQESAKQGRSMSDIVETALRLFFQNRKGQRPLSPFPSFKSGGYRVDIANRDALYQTMEGQ